MPRKTKYNNITSPEILKKLNRGNVRLKKDFLDYLRSVQRSPKTIAGYSNDLDIVLTWNYLYNNDKDFVKITKRDWTAFQNWLIQENGNSPARVRRLKAAISSLSNYIENILDDEDEFKNFRSVIRKIESPAMQQVRTKTVWEDSELEQLLSDLTKAGKHKQACTVALAMYSGRRKAELCRFRVSDFTDDNLVCNGALYKTTDPIQTKGFGLGKYIHCYTLAKAFKPYLDAWMAQREQDEIESEWLLPMESDPTQQIQESTLNSWAITFSNMTGRDFYWHALRHRFTTYLVRAGIPENVITQIVGWESADMCKVYTDIDADEQIGMYFNEDGDIDTSKRKSLTDI